MFIGFFRIIFLFLLFFSFPFSLAQSSCHSLFEGSLRSAQLISSSQAKAFDNKLPRFIDIMEESQLEKFWSSQTQDPSALSAFLPEDVSFINHRLRESQASHLVKFPATGSAVIARAKYESQGQRLETNISFSKEGLIDNLGAEQKWLVGPSSGAAVLFLHGGGTKSTGGHVAEAIINHFQKHNITVISPDLPWHGEGPRAFMGTLDQEMMSLSDLVTKYVHPNVPVFIWGHSWGGTFAHRIMQMTGEKEEGFFHKSLKGLIITSPALDPAPGKDLKEKKKAYFERKLEALKKEDQMAPNEGNIFQQIVLDGKTSHTGQMFASLTISQLKDIAPKHGGKDYLPALMLVGVGDFMVYLGFEDLFHNYYDELQNVEAHYLEELPLIMSRSEKVRVGHLLSDYLGPKGRYPVNFELAMDFMNRHADIKKSVINKNKQAPILDMLQVVQLWANDLSFREWSKNAKTFKVEKTDYYKWLKQVYQGKYNLLREKIYQHSPSLYLLKVLDDIPLDGFSSAKEKMKLAQRAFSSNGVFSALLKAEGLKEAQTQIEELTQQLRKQSNKKYKESFMKDIFGLLEKDSSLNSLQEKYPYLSKESMKRIQLDIQEIKILEQKLRENYVPDLAEYKEFDSSLSDNEAHWQTQKILNNLEERLELENRKKYLHQDLTKLIKKFNTDLDRIRSLIRQLKLILDETFIQPPEFLKTDFENSEKEFLNLYGFFEELEDKIEEGALLALTTQGLGLKRLHDRLAPHRPMIDEFNRRYDTFIKNRKNLWQKVLIAIKKGEYLKEAEYLAQELYGDEGLYTETEKLSIFLAQKEAERQRNWLQTVKLEKEYNQLLPYPALSNHFFWSAPEFLHLPNFNEERLKENRIQLQQILKNWKSLNSQVLPPLPK